MFLRIIEYLLTDQAFEPISGCGILMIEIINNCFQKKSQIQNSRTTTLTGYTENTVKIKTKTVHRCFQSNQHYQTKK